MRGRHPKYRRVILPLAVADLDEAAKFVAKTSSARAAELLTQLSHAIDSLERLPHRHKVYESRRADALSVRMLVSAPYLIYYRIDDASHSVRVLRVLHGARRQPKRFR